MQKKKNRISIKNSESGITVIVLVITIAILSIMIGIILSLGLDSVHETQDQALKSELHIVQQAIISEYIKANKMGYTNSNEKPSNFVGKQVTNLPVNINWEISSAQTEKYKAYYELTPENLEKLGILNSEDTYILNYYTGEVYNKTKEITSTGEKLYIKAIDSSYIQKEVDDTSFNDWYN